MPNVQSVPELMTKCAKGLEVFRSVVLPVFVHVVDMQSNLRSACFALGLPLLPCPSVECFPRNSTLAARVGAMQRAETALRIRRLVFQNSRSEALPPQGHATDFAGFLWRRLDIGQIGRAS